MGKEVTKAGVVLGSVTSEIHLLANREHSLCTCISRWHLLCMVISELNTQSILIHFILYNTVKFTCFALHALVNRDGTEIKEACLRSDPVDHLILLYPPPSDPRDMRVPGKFPMCRTGKIEIAI